MHGRRAIILGLALAGLAHGATAQATTREDAVRVALAGREDAAAAVYVTPAPLPRGSAVAEAGDGAWTVGRPHRRRGGSDAVVRSRLKPWRIRRPAWLVWQDLMPGATFAHPGRLVLVDDRSGRVVAQRQTAWWPTVGGRDAQGFGTAGRTFRTVRVAGGSSPPTALRPVAVAAQGGGARRPLPGLERDCMVVVGDRVDPQFASDLAVFDVVAGQLGIPKRDADGPEDLARRVAELERGGCRDVVLAIAAHGYPPLGWRGMGLLGLATGREVPTVRLRWRAGANGEARAAELTADDLERVIDANAKRGVHFKVVVASCFSGRFARLSDQRGVEAVATSSGPYELSWGHLDPSQRVGTHVSGTRLVPGTGPPIGGEAGPGSGFVGALADGIAHAVRAAGGDLARAILAAVADPRLNVAARLNLVHTTTQLGVSARPLPRPKPAATRLTIVNPDEQAGRVIGVVETLGDARCATDPLNCRITCGLGERVCSVDLAPGAVVRLAAQADRDRSAGAVLEGCPGDAPAPGQCVVFAQPQGGAITITVRWLPPEHAPRTARDDTTEGEVP